MDIKDIEKSLFKPSPVEQTIKLEFLDLPKYHYYGNSEGVSLFEALSNSEDIELFNNRGI